MEVRPLKIWGREFQVEGTASAEPELGECSACGREKQASMAGPAYLRRQGVRHEGAELGRQDLTGHGQDGISFEV